MSPLRLTEADLAELIAALDLFNKAERDHGVNVCAYGSITVELRGGGYLRLEHTEGVGYAFMENS